MTSTPAGISCSCISYRPPVAAACTLKVSARAPMRTCSPAPGGTYSTVTTLAGLVRWLTMTGVLSDAAVAAAADVHAAAGHVGRPGGRHECDHAGDFLGGAEAASRDSPVRDLGLGRFPGRQAAGSGELVGDAAFAQPQRCQDRARGDRDNP